MQINTVLVSILVQRGRCQVQNGPMNRKTHGSTNQLGFVDQKDNRGPLVPPLVQEKKRNRAQTPPSLSFLAKTRKILYRNFRAEGVEIRYPCIKQKLQRRSTLGIREKISARSDEGFRSYEHFKTADSYTQQNFDDFGKYAISVNMEAFILGQARLLCPHEAV